MSDEHGQGESHGSKKGHGKHGGHGGGHGGGDHEEHEGAPEWLISFADNTALMMGFFVILLALAMNQPTGKGEGNATMAEAVTTERMLDLAIAVREAFNNPVDLGSDDPKDLPLIRRIIERGESQAQDVGQKGREHDVRSIRPSDYFSTAGMVPFSESSASIGDVGKDAIAQLLPLLKGHNLIIEVRGHVSASESFGRTDKGMQLSYERSLAVAKAIADEGVPWRQIRLIAACDGERLVPKAYDAAQHQTNQRVELIVTDQVVADP